ncbi:5-hydroxytryptamine receptor 3C isoform X1 [Nothobranchius furzeri]|uniref:Transcript variant X1 n=1 Tax=Nothobranchius furzeri TaxID=105023 RepID=A0A9D2XJR4_NOTFU|nr:transcript variant X1 [Nothobranchius furzeri]KAF7202444.1 transcript variant X2 [Nothobranchius furzeri]
MQRSTFRIMTSKDKASKVPLSSTMPAVVVSIIFMPALCSTADVTCSKPNQPSLLAALTPIFNLSAIRPVLNQTTVTNVSVSFTLYGILGVDEKAQLLTTYIWLDYWWMNEFISWDQAQCGAKKISLPKEKFWLPDIVINEFMEENKAPSVPYVYLYNDGAVHDAMPVRVVSSCNLNIYTFPFDVQNCSLTFNSYIYYAFEIQVLLGSPAENITEDSKSVMTTMGEWELLDITALKTPNNDTMLYIDELAFYIRLRRRATMYVVNLLLPSCFLITVDLFSFLLPPQSVDRSSFKMTLILGYTVFLLIMNDLLPITGNTIPLINVFFSLCLALMVASLLETILITNLFCNSAGFSPVPRWIRVLILKIIGCLVCMPQKKPKDSVQRTSTVVARGESDGGPRETKGSSEDNKALQELRSLNKVLLDIRVQVEQQQKGKQSSEDWIQCCLMKIKPSKHLCILVSLLMIASCSSAALNCSQPGPTSLLSSLQTAFDLSAIRPVVNMSTPTTVSIGFTLYGILGVDEKAQVLTTYIWQNLEWQNEFTTWNAEECGVEWVAIPRTLLWVPDVVINELHV